MVAHRSVGDGAVLDAVGLDDHDLGFVDDLNHPGLFEEGGRERRDEVLAIAATNHERRPGQAGGDNAIGLVEGDREKGEVPLEAREDAAAGLGEIPVVLLLDQVDERLGVGIGGERVSARSHAFPQLDVVLEDAVHQDGEAAILGGEGVRVAYLDTAVRGPAGVAHTERGGFGDLTSHLA